MKQNTISNQPSEPIKQGNTLIAVSTVMLFILISVLLYQRFVTKPLVESHTATTYSLMDTRSNMYNAHLRLEEAIIENNSIEIESIFNPVKQMIKDLSAKGSIYEMSLNYGGSELNDQLNFLLQDIEKLTSAAKYRYKNKSTSYAGTKSDKTFDSTFNNSIQTITNIENLLKERVSKRLRHAGYILNILIIFTISLFGWNISGIYRYSRQARDTQSALADEIKNLSFHQSALNEHAIVSLTDAKGNITYANDKFEQISQYSLEELIGQNHRILKSGFHSDTFFKDMWQSIANGKVWHGEIKNKAKDGSIYWVSSTIVPQINESGKPHKYLSIRTDITHIKALEASQALLHKDSLRREKYNKTLLDSLTIGLAVCTLDGTYSYLNPALANMLGYSVEEVKGLSYWDVTPKSYAHDERLQLEQLDSTGHYGPYEKEYIHKDGHHIPVRLQGLLIEDKGEVFIWSSIEDITDIHVQQQKLQIAKDDAEKANKAKSEFLSSMSHELRTPLNAILGFGQLLENDLETPLSEDQKENVDYILSGGQHLLSLVNDVLELSAIESGKLEVSIESINLSDLMDETLVLIGPIAEKANIKLQIKSDLVLAVNADYIRLKQVLINLTSNAIKYNKPEGTVSFEWHKTDHSTLKLNITDTGIGIPADKHEKVFSAFNRLGQESSTIEGTGVGLVVTKELIEAMGGSIGFDSEEGQGTTFWIELPLTDELESV